MAAEGQRWVDGWEASSQVSEAQGCCLPGSRALTTLFFLPAPRPVVGAAVCFPWASSVAPEGRFPEPALTPGTHLPRSKGPCQPGLIKDRESLAAALRLQKGHLSAVWAPAGLSSVAQP